MGSSQEGHPAARRVAHRSSTEAPLAALLPVLEGVRRYGRGYRADCPCGHKSRGTLSIVDNDEGVILMHCFVGCTVAEILFTLGLTLAALFPERHDFRDLSETERRQMRQRAREAQWLAALEVLHFESTVALVAAGELAQLKPLSPDDQTRLTIAVERISNARMVLRAR